MQSKQEQHSITDKAREICALRGIDPTRVPAHVAIIMDGNGRWAQRRGLDRSEGHTAGVTSLHNAVQFASDAGVKYLTVYAFSTENWNRPQTEVDALMHLIGWAIARELPELIEKNVRIRLIGDIGRIPPEARKSLYKSVEETARCTGMTLCMCLSYSSRWEIVDAARKLAVRAARGEIDPQSISEDDFAASLDSAGVPDPDLLIRTGGEYRISNYLLWQAAYSELFFSPALWPDFDADEFARAIRDYQSRERRFGKTSAQVADNPSSGDASGNGFHNADSNPAPLS